MNTITGKSARALPRLMPLLTLLILAGCETDTAQLVQEIDAAREGCTDEMLEAGAEECVQMFEKYIDMGTGAIETYIGAMRAFDAAVDRGEAVRFDTAGLGHAISPELWGSTDADRTSSLHLWEVEESLDERPLYADDAAAATERSGANYRPNYAGPEATSAAEASALRDSDLEYDARRPPALSQGQSPRRGAILPPAERLQRPWLGDERPQESYYPEDASRREPVKRQTEDARAGRSQPSERPPL